MSEHKSSTENQTFSPFAPMQAMFDWWQSALSEENGLSKAKTGAENTVKAKMTQADLMTQAARGNLQTIAEHNHKRMADFTTSTNALAATMTGMNPMKLAADYQEYIGNAMARMVITADILRQRGDNFKTHENADCPPVLVFDYELVLSGLDMPRPSNYQLLQITPPSGCKIDDTKRPYVIIDPRAGHGAGIGGFKPDSQVGVAMADGHPVYFIGFTRQPAPGQTISDITDTEAEFLREVERRHPKARKPVVVGNCQGGWAALLLAATNPDLTGPMILSGSPVSTWEGTPGENPMRYNAGVLGGTWLPMLMSDLGNGRFDGAGLVTNFEQLNPSRNYIGKYTDLYKNPLKGEQRFLDFERWWGGFFLLNEAEIRWIVEELFVGNKLARNEARLHTGEPVDLKNIESPLIIFASWGDNITPPEQALAWILETYNDEKELKVLGRKIIYRVHESTGHLGIFVSASIAKKEHSEFASVLTTIEALPPGLYEMDIENRAKDGEEPDFMVDFDERSFAQLAKVVGTSEDRPAFAAVERLSEMQANIYDATLRPAIQAMVNEPMAEMSRQLNPARLTRSMWSSENNPLAAYISKQAENYRQQKPGELPDNPFVATERLWIDTAINSLDIMKEWRDFTYEQCFFSVWASPWSARFGADYAHSRSHRTSTEIRNSPNVQNALAGISEGGFAEGMVRILLLISDAEDEVTQDGIEKLVDMISEHAPGILEKPETAVAVLQAQTLMTTYDKKRSIITLPDLLRTPEERQTALEVLIKLIGPASNLKAAGKRMLQQICRVLEQPEPTAKAATANSKKKTRKAS